jgi:RPA family protein
MEGMEMNSELFNAMSVSKAERERHDREFWKFNALEQTVRKLTRILKEHKEGTEGYNKLSRILGYLVVQADRQRYRMNNYLFVSE